MKLDEEFWPDRVTSVETDDEENQAETDCDRDYDSESDLNGPSRDQSSDNITGNSPTWPQSYRKSMDMYFSVTPPSISFLRGISPTAAYKRSHHSLPESGLSKPLISDTSLDKEEAIPTSTVHSKLSAASDSRLSANELPTDSSLQKCSYAQSLLNAINVLSGIGILSTPYALKEGGWSSLIILLILGIVTCYTGILLQRCLGSSPGLQTYPDIGQAAFGWIGRICVAAVLYVELYSSCVEYLIMMSDNLSTLFPDIGMEIAGIRIDSYQLCAIISTLVILPTVCSRNLSWLSYISVGGVIALVMVVLCLFWVGLVDRIGFHPSGAALRLANLPVTVGIFGFCWGSHSVFPNLYSSMKEPSRFPSVLVISYATSLVLYTAIAVWGFLMFGDSTKSQFTLNMPAKYVASKIAAWAVVATPVTKFALTMNPVAYGIEELLPSHRLNKPGISPLISTILLFSTLVVALTVPYFGSVMALIGSLLVMLVAVIFPCVCYLSILHGRLSNWQIVKCYIVIMVGALCSILGTYSAIESIADQKA